MAAGKSTVARLVSEQTGAELLSFGDLVRAEAARLNLGNDRQALQELGQALYLERGPVGMSNSLLGDRRANVIIEGVRHLDVLHALGQILPDLMFIYLTATEVALDERWRTRGVPGGRAEAAAHAVESDLAALRPHAAMILDTSQLSAELISQLLARAAKA